MKPSRLNPDTRENTYLLLCAKVAKQSQMEIENVTGSTHVPEEAFNSFMPRNTVRKLHKKILAERGDMDWSRGLTIGAIVDYFWPKEKIEEKKFPKKKGKKKK